MKNSLFEAVRLAERMKIADYVDCGCPERDAVLESMSNNNNSRNWYACGSNCCAAIEAQEIRLGYYL